MSLINVGDEITNTNLGRIDKVTSVERGQYGLLVKHEAGRFFAPYELPPQPFEWEWAGWASRSSVLLANGFTIGIDYA